ncbi:MAG: WD40 repeat domain-containing protein [Pseudomonadota bacterium]
MNLKINDITEIKSPFDCLGQPTGVFENEKYLVVSSYVEEPFSKLRSIKTDDYFCNRVSIFDSSTLELISSKDAINFKIKDVAFHPAEPLIALATGEYDGGQYFEGELLIWNWENNKITSILDSIMVLRCEFSNNGETVDILTTGYSKEEDHSYGLFVQENISVSSSNQKIHFNKPFYFNDSKFDCTYLEIYMPDFNHQASIKNKLQSFSEKLDLNYKMKSCVWDIDWLSSNLIACTSDKNILEIWNTNGTFSVYSQDEGFSCLELAVSKNKDSIFLNLFSNTDFEDTHSKILEFDIETQKFQAVKVLDYSVSISISSDEDILLRDVEGESSITRDFLIHDEDNYLDLGNYFPFRQYIRINNQRFFFYTRGQNKRKYGNHHLFYIDPQTKKSQETVPFIGPKNGSIEDITGCIFENSFIFAAIYYNSDPDHPTEGFICSRHLQDRKLQWSLNVPSQTTVLAPIEKKGLVFYALTNGEVGFIQFDNGEKIYSKKLIIDGLKTCVICASYKDEKIVAGTIDGRIIIMELDF